MLNPRAVAVVGASPREGSPGRQMVPQLRLGGWDGEVYPVNPRYDDVLGLRCYPSLMEVPSAPELVLLGVPNAALEEQLGAAARARARGVVIFASAHQDAPPAEGPSLAERLRAIAREAGMVVCGPNCMGFVDVERGLRALAFEEREDLEPGPVTWLSHSGSAFSALLHNDRGIRFNLAVSTGLELTTTMADYLAVALERPSTGVVAVFLETVRDPGAFREALALAGEDAAHEALFDAHGVVRVETLDELADTVELFAAGRRAGPGGLAAIHDSAGGRAHLVDVAARVGVRLADISERTRDRLAARLDPGLPAVNPLDAWGTGRDYEAVFDDCMRVLLDDPAAAALAFAVDLSGEDLEPGYMEVARHVYPSTEKPMAVLTNLTSAVAPGAAAALRAVGIPVLEGTATGLLAFRHLFEQRDASAREPVAPPAPGPSAVRGRRRGRLGDREPFTEAEALAMVAAYGVPTVEATAAASEHEAVAAAEALGWPVALKTAEASHKSDVDGVRLGLAEPEALRHAYRNLAGRLDPPTPRGRQGPAGRGPRRRGSGPGSAGRLGRRPRGPDRGPRREPADRRPGGVRGRGCARGAGSLGSRRTAFPTPNPRPGAHAAGPRGQRGCASGARPGRPVGRRARERESSARRPRGGSR